MVKRQVWKEEESPAYFGVPDTALFKPWDLPNPTDQAPTLVDYHAIHYSDAGGYAPAGPCPEMFGAFGGPGLPGMAQPESQFNPFVTENIPPKIEDVAIKTKEEWHYGICEHAWAEIDVYVTEVAPYTARIGVIDRNTYVVFAGQGGIFKEKLHAVIDLDYWKDVADDYKVNVTLNDTAQNKMFYQKEIEGWFGGVLNFLEDIWNVVCGMFSAAWEAVKEAMNFIYDLVMAIIQVMIQSVIDSLLASLSNWGAGLSQYLVKSSVSSMKNIESITSASLEYEFISSFFDYLLFPIGLISAIIYTIAIAEVMLKSTGLGAAITKAASTIVKLVLSSVIGLTAGVIAFGIAGGPDKFIGTITNLMSPYTDLAFGVIPLIGTILYYCKFHKLNQYVPGVAIAFLGLFISMFTTGPDEPALWNVIWDSVGAFFVVFGIWDAFFGPDDIILRTFSDITDILDVFGSTIAAVALLIDFEYHAYEGWYD